MIIINKVKDALLSVMSQVYYLVAPENQDAPYIVWYEQSDGDSLYADGIKVVEIITGKIEYITKKENDENVLLIETALKDYDIAEELVSVHFDQKTNLIHYEWKWQAI